MNKIVAAVGWFLCAVLVLFGIVMPGVSTLFFLVAAVLVCPLFRKKVKLPKKIWIPAAVVIFLIGCILAPKVEQPQEDGGQAPAASSTLVDESPAQEETVEPEVVEPSAPDTVPAESQEPEAEQPAVSQVVADAYTVPLGSGLYVTVEKHPVLSGTGTVIFNIGVGKVEKAAAMKASSDDLSAFIGALDFDSYGYDNIVLEFEDGTGIVFSKGMASFTDTYGVVDVSAGNFEIVESLGSIWNDTGDGWYYMTAEEMEAADAAG